MADDEGEYIIVQTFLEHDDPADPTVAVLERMNALILQDRYKTEVAYFYPDLIEA